MKNGGKKDSTEVVDTEHKSGDSRQKSSRIKARFKGKCEEGKLTKVHSRIDSIFGLVPSKRYIPFKGMPI